MSLSDLKKNRAGNLAKFAETAKAIAEGLYAPDERFWAPTVDKAGNGYAVIRFLPAVSGEELPWVRFWDHGFKGPTGRWYIETSLTSIGKQDPIGEYNSRLWNSGNEKDKDIVRKQKRRLHYVANILVLDDPAEPKNNGTVRLYKFGKKIFDKILDKMQPQFPGEKAINPFDLWDGATFQLKIRQVEGYRNYDKSEFNPAGALFDDEGKLEAVYKLVRPLKEFVDPKNFKSYEELRRKLIEVLGPDAVAQTSAQKVNLEDQDAAAPAAPSADALASEPAAQEPAPALAPTAESAKKAQTLSYFAKLAAQE